MTRQSNMELARVLSMLFVLVFHADFLSLGWPTQSDSINEPISTVFKLLIESATVICVDSFVLISGWFGIKPTVKKGIKLILTVLFYSIAIFIVLAIIKGPETITIDSIKNTLLLSTGYWFIKCYLLLLILTPALNLLVETADEPVFRKVLIALALFQTVFGWSNATFDYHHGYSTLLFIFLYLLGRYVRKYPIKLLEKRAICLLLYIVLSVVMTVFTYAATRFEAIPSSLVWYSFNYLNPFVILSAISFMLFFTKLNLKSKAVNWIASSCLAVYLIHANDALLPIYAGKVFQIASTNGTPVLSIAIFIIIVYMASILIDKLRILLFRLVNID